MNTCTVRTGRPVNVANDTYESLKAEAARRGMPIRTLADLLLRAALAKEPA